MDRKSSKAILKALQPYEYGWRAEVPRQHGTFFGETVAVQIETQAVPDDDPPPAVNAAELALAESILTGLREVLSEAEQQFTEYNATKNPDASESVCEPHIWICREAMEEEGEDQWTFIVGQEDAPDFGYHIEFTELEAQEIWAGE